MTGNLTSAVTSIQYLDNVGVQFNFTGTPTGSFAVQVSADYDQDQYGNVVNAGNWISLSLSPSPSAAGSASSIYIDMTQLSAPWIRSTYTSTATGVQTITTVADVAGSLNSKYFLLNSANGGTNYYVWINVASGGVDPMVAGRTGVPVAISTSDTANTIATAVASAIDALATFVAPAPGANVITVTNSASGPFTPASDFNTGFTFAVTVGNGTLNSFITAKMI